MVYCRSDAAYLCLSCDRNVHSANPLSKRHMRTLVCDVCNSQPALVRCVDEKASLCQNCDWLSHNGDNLDASTHSRQTLNCYSGCPSAVELSSIWSFMSESCEQEMGSMSIADNTQEPSGNNQNQDSHVNFEVSNLQIEDNPKVKFVTFRSVIISVIRIWDFPGYVCLLKFSFLCIVYLQISCSGTKNPEQVVDDGVYDDYTMDEVDMNIENYEELFGVGSNDPKHLFAKDGIDSLFGKKDETKVSL